MTAQIRCYPIGIQSFEKLRALGNVYIDKTEYVYRLTHGSGNAIFLSRPRRFGKSLFVSTLQAYFEGKRELFEGLAIDALESEWEAYPVLRIDLSMVKARDLNVLQRYLDDAITRLEAQFGVVLPASTLGGRLTNLIIHAHEQTGKKVVVLIDEYDAPLLNVIDDSDALEAFRQVMREFYIPLKGCDEHLRFVFLTGITKFSQLSIFSELNNLRNISMDPQWAAICGIAEEELCGQMGQDIEQLAQRLGVSYEEALARLKKHYDGYHFADPSPDIYNPFSLLNAFAEGRIRSFWFGSGTPTFLLDVMKKYHWELPDLEHCAAREAAFDAPTERLTSPLPMLYQSGYLTIKSYDAAREAYVLGIPNEEVRRGLSEGLLLHIGDKAFNDHYGFLDQFADDIRSGNIQAALEKMRAYLAGIPYHLGSRDERGFQTVFFLIFDLLGIQIQTEFKTATGRADAVVESADAVYVMEFKYGKSAQEALDQIDSRGYLVPFSAGSKVLVKVGVNFSPETRTIDEWVIQGV